MEIIKCDSYSDFQEKHLNIYEERMRKSDRPDILYRGQSNIHWGLESTLERILKDKIVTYNPINYTERIMDYYKSQNNQEALSKIQDLNLREEFKNIKNCDSVVWEVGPKIIEFWIYARHFGKPSPLLDLTRNIDVATFFAFSDLFSDEVAIFMIVSSNSNPIGEAKNGDKKILKKIDPVKIEVDRHINQKSVYVLTTLLGSSSNRHSFQSMNESSLVEDSLLNTNIYKFEIKKSKLLGVMDFLNENGINEEYIYARS